MGEEKWLPVRGWEGLYEVSNMGRVRSLDRTVERSDGKVAQFRGRDLKINVGVNGYPRVGLTDSSRGITSYLANVHVLVAEAFVEGEAPGLHILHYDDDKTNNVWTNLRWGTPAENVQDTLRNGHNFHANKTHCNRGHEFTPENTRVIASRPTARYCRTCQVARSRAHYRTTREAATSGK
jgi:hypothetical protein